VKINKIMASIVLRDGPFAEHVLSLEAEVEADEDLLAASIALREKLEALGRRQWHEEMEEWKAHDQRYPRSQETKPITPTSNEVFTWRSTTYGEQL
jgi:hypothetical protein